ncbi:MAG: DnaJ domain-containing protein [Archangium sp.]
MSNGSDNSGKPPSPGLPQITPVAPRVAVPGVPRPGVPTERALPVVPPPRAPSQPLPLVTAPKPPAIAPPAARPAVPTIAPPTFTSPPVRQPVQGAPAPPPAARPPVAPPPRIAAPTISAPVIAPVAPPAGVPRPVIAPPVVAPPSGVPRPIAPPPGIPRPVIAPPVVAAPRVVAAPVIVPPVVAAPVSAPPVVAAPPAFAPPAAAPAARPSLNLFDEPEPPVASSPSLSGAVPAASSPSSVIAPPVAAAPVKVAVRTNPIPPSGAIEALSAQQAGELRALAASLDTLDYFGVLCIPQTATPGEIKKAFYRESRTYHPDRFFHLPDSQEKTDLGAVYRRITESYYVLRDDAKRKKYLADLAGAERSNKLRYTEATEAELKAEVRKSVDEEFGNNPKSRPFFKSALADIEKQNWASAERNLKMGLTYDRDNARFKEHLTMVQAKIEEHRRSNSEAFKIK